MSTKKSLGSYASAVALACLSACGGGGGDLAESQVANATSSTPSTTPVPSSPASNTSPATPSAPVVAPNITAQPANAPTITLQPASTQAIVGSTASFKAAVAESGVAFQWQQSVDGVNWLDIPSATQKDLNIRNVTLSMTNLQVRVVASKAGAGVTSASAQLSVVERPVTAAITSSPESAEVLVGADATFSVTATGTTLAYQWQARSPTGAWQDLNGETQAVLTLKGLTIDLSGHQLRVQVSNSLRSVTSAAATITVLSEMLLPNILVQPVAVSVVAAREAKFLAAASGQPSPTLQWERSTDGGQTFVAIPGATTNSYREVNPTVGQTGHLYRVVATNSGGRAASAPAALTVTAQAVAPSVVRQPTSQTVEAGQTVEFSAEIAASPTPEIRWQVSTGFDARGNETFADILGATQSKFSYVATMADSGARLRLGAFGVTKGVSAPTNVVTLTVTEPRLYASIAGPRNVLAGSTVTWTGAAAGPSSSAATQLRWELMSKPALSGASIGAQGTSVTAGVDRPGVYELSLSAVGSDGTASRAARRTVRAFSDREVAAIMSARGCPACHLPDSKTDGLRISPSWREISTKYAAQTTDGLPQVIDALLKGSSGRWSPKLSMPAVEGMTIDEAEILARWVLAFK